MNINKTVQQRIFAWFLFIILCLVPLWLYAGSQTISETSGSTIITRARYYLNEVTASDTSFWTDAQLLVFLNDGTMNIVARTHCLENTEAVTLLLDEPVYALSDPFIVIKHVIYNSEEALKKGSIDEMGRVEDSLGEPTHWAQWESNLVVYPKPATPAVGNVVTAYVVERPVAVATDENVVIPAQYDKALVYYIVAQALKKDGRLGLAAAFIAEYNAELDRYRLDFNTQPNVVEKE